MSYKNKIIILIFLLALVSGFLFWYFLFGLDNKNKEIIFKEGVQLTEQQKLEILSATSNLPVQIMTNEEKRNILSETDPNIAPTNILSRDEIYEILNKKADY